MEKTLDETNITDKIQQVNDKVIDLLEQDEKTWIYPYNPNNSKYQDKRILPYNLKTKKDYSGINAIILAMAAKEKHYSENGWLTRKQAEEYNGAIIKNKKGVTCFYFKSNFNKEKDSKEVKNSPIQKTCIEFNIDQIKYIGLKEHGFSIKKTMSSTERCEKLIEATGANIKHNGIYGYSMQEDIIRVKSLQDVCVPNDYYFYILRELILWSSHENRLNLFAKIKLSKEQRHTFETLVVDIALSFLCAKLKINTQTVKEGIYQNREWIPLLKSDPKLLFKAAFLANIAYKYLIGFIKDDFWDNYERYFECFLDFGTDYEDDEYYEDDKFDEYW